MPTGHYAHKQRAERVQISCEVCGMTRDVLPSMARRVTGRFCSQKCAGAAKSKGAARVIGPCAGCGLPTSRLRAHVVGQVYCSKECYGRHAFGPKVERLCPSCGVNFTTVAKRPRRCCSDACAEKLRQETRERWSNTEKVRQYMREYVSRNREKLTRRDRELRRANPAAHHERQRRWRETHREMILVATEARRAGVKRGDFDVAAWREVRARYGFRCVCCGRANAKQLEMDHVKPLSKGGLHVAANIQPLCRSCNASKGAKEIDYREHFRAQYGQEIELFV